MAAPWDEAVWDGTFPILVMSIALGEALRSLEGVLRQKAPLIAGALRPGLTEDQVRQFGEDVSLKFPESVVQLYGWHDGTETVPGSVTRAELFPDGPMLPLADAVALRAGALEADRQSRETIWQPSWLPIFTDEVGRFRVVLCETGGGQVLLFDVVDLPRRIIEHADLRGLIDLVRLQWQAGGYRQGPEGNVEQDRQIRAEVYRAEETGPVDINRLVADLDSGSEDDYHNALYRIRTRLYPVAVPALIRVLQRGSERGRLAAAELLGAIGDPTAEEPLRAAVSKDPSDVVRGTARKSWERLSRLQGI